MATGTPTAVKKQIKAAEAKHKELEEALRQQEEATTEEVTPDPAGAVLADAEPDPSPEPTPGAASAPEPDPAPEPEHDAAYWEQRFRTLEGVNEQMRRQAEGQMRAMAQRVEDLQRAQVRESVDEELGITEDEVEEFGSDMIDVMRKASRETVQPILDNIRQENAALRAQLQQITQNVGNMSQHQHHNTMESFLDQRVPDWRQINENQNFWGWLDTMDPLMGSSRREALTHAWQMGDGNRVVAFFQSYLADSAPAQQADTQLREAAAPGRSRAAGGDGASQEKPVWTPKSVQQFYSDVRRGAYAGREAEQRRIEADIVAAPNEGRYRA